MPSEPVDDRPLLDVARVVKPHGLQGEVVVELWSDRPERLAAGSILTSDGGPLIVVSSRLHQSRYLVLFEGVADRTSAEGLRGLVLRAEALPAEDVVWVHELVGAAVETTDGRPLGRVSAVESNPASDLLVLESGGLIPLVFVTDRQPGVRVTVDIPDGLLD